MNVSCFGCELVLINLADFDVGLAAGRGLTFCFLAITDFFLSRSPNIGVSFGVDTSVFYLTGFSPMRLIDVRPLFVNFEPVGLYSNTFLLFRFRLEVGDLTLLTPSEVLLGPFYLMGEEEMLIESSLLIEFLDERGLRLGEAPFIRSCCFAAL